MSEVTGIALGAGPTGALHIMATSGDEESPGAVLHAWQMHFDEQPTSGWNTNSLGRPDSGVARERPAVTRNADARLEVVIVGKDRAVWHRWQTAPQGSNDTDDDSGGVWSGWQSLGRPGGQAAMAVAALARNKDGRLELFTVGGDGMVWHRWQRAPGGSWAAWSSLGTPGGQHAPGVAAVARNKDGRLELFTVGGDGMVWHRWQRAPGRRTWAPWSSLGTPGGQHAPGGLVVARNIDGRLELFTVASDGAVWHSWQRSTGGWQAWETLDSQAGGFNEVAVGANADGRLVVFAIAASSASGYLWWREQVVAGGWSPWSAVEQGLGPKEPGEGPTLASMWDARLILLLRIPPPAVLYELTEDGQNGPWTSRTLETFGWGG
jgi:hypothetical protein